MKIFKMKIHTQIFIALILGVSAGILFGEQTRYIKIVGDIFIRLLRMVIVPLVMASMIAGVVSIGNVRKLGRIGLRTIIYYMVTTLLAVAVGLVLVNLTQPGVGVSIEGAQAVDLSDRGTLTLGSLITDMVPKNIFQATAQGKMLSIIFFSLLLGVGLSSVGDKGRPVAAFFEALNVVMLKITDWVMRLAPFGIFALMAVLIGKNGIGIVGSLGKYIFTVIGGLAIHACITIPLLLWIFGRYSPLKFFSNMFSAVGTAFSTASSAATLPITMDCLERNVGVSNKVTSFVLPLGATINMDGTALYEAVAAMFIAQAYGINLGPGQQIIIMLTATLASIGAAAIPGAGLVTMVIVLKAVGLPIEGIGMILAVDRILDMCRTSVNVWGDSCGAAIIARMEGEELTNN